jgi:predicted ATPase/class 3 adenylate cyclase
MSSPTGILTFLFTDIEGSTKLWEQFPEEMDRALARHDTLLRQAVDDHHGLVVKGTGDGLLATFVTTADALAGAVAAQIALTDEPWPDTVAIRVRMALHTGPADRRDGDYFGPPLNRCARLLAIGHGGQILLSGAAQESVRDALPTGAVLQPLGDHRLKDLQRAETVFQLRHPALPSDFPPLRSLDSAALPNNLPSQVTSFIGREREMGEIKALLGSSTTRRLGRTRLLTLTGAGGAGKTRLALQVAADLLDTYPEGVWLVELAALTDPALVPFAVAQALSVPEEAGTEILRTLTDALRSKRLLIVMDNCEHLVAACARVASELIRMCPGVDLLATSREALRIAGESQYRVPSLALPDPGEPPSVAGVARCESVRLFVERARAVAPSFVLTDGSAPALVSVCRRLDGIPLAIELAAARVRAMPAEQIAARLDDRFRLLTGGSRTALPRQQTLRALIDWSYDLLSEQETVLLNRLSVFAGGWTLEAAERVCADLARIERWEVLDLLTALVDKSLVIYEPAGRAGEAGELSAGDQRYRLLETIRQYAQERLGDSEGETVWRGRHRDYFVLLADETDKKLRGPEQVAGLARLAAEHDNLRAALAWCHKESGEGHEGGTTPGADGALRLCSTLWWFWMVRGFLSEGRAHCAAALSAPAGAAERTATRAKALSGAGTLAQLQGDYIAARRSYEESLAILREQEDPMGMSQVLGNLGITVQSQGDYALARSLHEESLAISRALNDRKGIADDLNNLGYVAYAQGDYDAARSLYEQGLPILRELGDSQGVANALNNLGSIASDQGDYAAARALFEESLAAYRELGNRWSIAISLLNLGIVARDQADYTSARSLLAEGLTMQRELGDQQIIAVSLEAFATLAAKQGDVLLGARLWGAEEALREAIASPRPPNEQKRYDETIAATREAAGEMAFAAAWAAGRALTPERAIACALAENADSAV